MTVWRRITGGTVMPAPVAVRPVDDFSAGAPALPVAFVLDRLAATSWTETGLEPVRTLSGVFAWPGLGRVPDAALAPAEQYRVRFSDPAGLAHYRAAYGFSLDGLVFTVAPWSLAQPPASAPLQPETVFLYPGAAYPFASNIAVLRGRTVTLGGDPLADSLVASGTDRVLSDPRGAFALPIRLTAAVTTISVTADHARTGTSNAVTIAVPAGLIGETQIQLS